MPLETTRRKRIDRTRGHLYNNDYSCISHSPFLLAFTFCHIALTLGNCIKSPFYAISCISCASRAIRF